jgi:CubicO group peptidase (beta-lactamase class C family)
MKRWFAVCLVLALPMSVSAKASTVHADPRFSEVRQLIIDQVNDGIVPSIAVAVAESGRVVWEEAFGWADLESRVPATPQTMYRLGSISKTFTATGIMILAEEGRVDLDGPAIDYLPEDVRPQVLHGEPGDITVRMLLNHRAGMPAYAESFYEDEPDSRRPLAETVRRYGIVVFPLDWTFVYCNLGYQIAGSIISEVSGTEYEDFIEERIFAPLGMTESIVYRGEEPIRPYAVNYTQDMQRIPLYLDSHPGADGNCASAHDLIRFAMFFLQDELEGQEAILTRESIESMWEKEPPSNDRYGIGWSLDGDERGFQSVYHGGEGPGVDSMMRLFPTEDMAGVILCNCELEKLYEIQKAIFAAMIPELGEPEPESEPEPEAEDPESSTELPAEPTEIYGWWVGSITTYDRELKFEVVIDSEGVRATVEGSPQDVVDLYVLSPTFAMGMFDAKIPTPDNERHPYRNRLEVVREGDRLFGAVISVGSWEARAGHYELPSRVELRRRANH